ALSMVLAFGSCKPKQSAYKAAYEQAKEKESTAPVEAIVEEDEVEIVPVSKPRTSDAATRTEKINAAEGEDANHLKRFSVVIGSFKNKTNAYSLKDRMQNDGYNAVLGENEEGMLRVIVTSFDDKADAVDSREAIKSKYAPNFQDAWILERQY
ncbi:MAG: SPOR domain-containing protein, partial [Tannerellaceae bacterium]|nr:SPOR domain-containing protein [Tannerellaceae bacterium]